MVGLAGLLTGQAVDAGLQWLAKNYETQKEEDYGQGTKHTHSFKIIFGCSLNVVGQFLPNRSCHKLL